MRLTANSVCRGLSARTAMAAAAGNYPLNRPVLRGPSTRDSCICRDPVTHLLGMIAEYLVYGVKCLFKYWNAACKVDEFQSLGLAILAGMKRAGPSATLLVIDLPDRSSLRFKEVRGFVEMTMHGRRVQLPVTRLWQLADNIQADFNVHCERLEACGAASPDQFSYRLARIAPLYRIVYPVRIGQFESTLSPIPQRSCLPSQGPYTDESFQMPPTMTAAEFRAKKGLQASKDGMSCSVNYAKNALRAAGGARHTISGRIGRLLGTNGLLTAATKPILEANDWASLEHHARKVKQTTTLLNDWNGTDFQGWVYEQAGLAPALPKT